MNQHRKRLYEKVEIIFDRDGNGGFYMANRWYARTTDEDGKQNFHALPAGWSFDPNVGEANIRVWALLYFYGDTSAMSDAELEDCKSRIEVKR